RAYSRPPRLCLLHPSPCSRPRRNERRMDRQSHRPVALSALLHGYCGARNRSRILALASQRGLPSRFSVCQSCLSPFNAAHPVGSKPDCGICRSHRCVGSTLHIRSDFAMRILFLAIVVLLAALPAAAAERTATFSVPGMTCPFCPITVTTAI